MLLKILPFVVLLVVLAVVNKFIIEPLWGELVFTALAAGATVYVTGKLNSGHRSHTS
ncbi:hypothetical protein [Streptomyces sp. KL118A]|uniref:hypothetical protein n=1 Tax=Streptomyces sp. KL118A TaxID=3045153 RepID=UPI00278BDAB9|nr:hypothetical protein [Streptomyces sp. KL118A]